MDIDTRSSIPTFALDSFFATAVPLPYRILLLVGIGLLAWASNLHILHLLGVDTGYALDIRRPGTHEGDRSPLPTTSHQLFMHSSTFYKPIYRLFTIFITSCVVSWIFFRYETASNPLLMDRFKIIPALTMVSLSLLLLGPWNVLQRGERSTFMRASLRCFIPRASFSVYFSDVLLADIFTSFAKVIGDSWIACQMLLPGGSLVSMPVETGFRAWIVPCLMSLPYVIRFRQCLKEHSDSDARPMRPLYNALKYATAFPVIFLSAAQKLHQRSSLETSDQVWFGESQLFRIWLLAVFINSMYSFWWDLTFDWGLDLFWPSSWSPHPNTATVEDPSERKHRSLSNRTSSHALGLRPRLTFGDPALYYMIIILNFILRFTWSLKLSSHLHNVAEQESGVFIMEALEIFRRWVWTFLRVEWEVQRKNVDLVHDVEEEYEFLSRAPSE